MFERYDHFVSFLYTEKPRIGICAPSDLTSADIETVLSSILKPYHLGVHISPDRCIDRKQSYKLSGYQIFSLAFLSMVIVCTLIGSTITKSSNVEEPRPSIMKSPTQEQSLLGHYGLCLKVFFRCFDMKSNIDKLFQFRQRSKVNDSQVDLSCLNGLKSLTMVIFLLNHTYLFQGLLALWIYRKYLMRRHVQFEARS